MLASIGAGGLPASGTERDAIGRPTGLVRIGETVSLTAAVTDEEPARKREPLRTGESLR